jgi:hypothetical protein
MSPPPHGGPRRAAERTALAAEILLAYLRARRELRRSPIDRVVARLRGSRTSSSRVSDAATCEEARRLGRVVVRVLRLLPGDTRCLRRSLVLLQLLARRGIANRLVIGARTEPDFLAHAWVECDGVAVLSPLDGSFGRLVEI